MEYYNKFYRKSSKKFKKYQFKTDAKVIKGKKPDFFSLVKRYANKKLIALDLGCGSGELAIQLAPYFKQITGID
jgi:methylase of polypeptide subunit release factors